MRPSLTHIWPTALPQVCTQNKICYFDSAFLCVQSYLLGFFFISPFWDTGHCSHVVRPCAALPQVWTQDKVGYCSSAFQVSVVIFFVSRYLSCLKHGATVHTQFDLVPPYRKFEPRIRYAIALPLSWCLLLSFFCISPVSNMGPPFTRSSISFRPTPSLNPE